MPQQVEDRDRPLGIHQPNLSLAGVRVVFLGGNLGAAELGQVAGDRVAERELALVVQDHHSDAGHRLGHRVDPEDRIPGHGLPALAIHAAIGLEVDDLAVTRDQSGGPGDLIRIDVLLHPHSDSRQARGEKPACSGDPSESPALINPGQARVTAVRPGRRTFLSCEVPLGLMTC